MIAHIQLSLHDQAHPIRKTNDIQVYVVIRPALVYIGNSINVIIAVERRKRPSSWKIYWNLRVVNGVEVNETRVLHESK